MTVEQLEQYFKAAQSKKIGNLEINNIKPKDSLGPVTQCIH
jgi:hypothetical protein